MIRFGLEEMVTLYMYFLQTHRHGDRSPWYVFPQDDVSVSYWYEGLGQLSEVSHMTTM